MDKLRILITNNALANRAGTELYVRDIAAALLGRGHTPIAYSTTLGDVAAELRAATIPVIDDLDALAVPPDVIHGHHHLETMTALLRFPGVPAIYFCHGWRPWEEAPPKFPRILRYVAVDNTCRDRLICESGIEEGRTRVLPNFVDTERFRSRGRLPDSPKRALVFSNNASEKFVGPVRKACERAGISLDVFGLSSGNVLNHPERILERYDIAFAVGRSALEALAVGTAVVLCDEAGAGPLVTSAEVDQLRALNFGIRALRRRVDVDTVAGQIARYDSNDALKVSERIRAVAGKETAIDEIVSMYREVIAESNTTMHRMCEEERAASAYLRWLSPTLKEVYRLRGERFEVEQELLDKEAELKRIAKTLGWRLLGIYGPVKYGVVLPVWNYVRRRLGPANNRSRSEWQPR